MAIDYRLYLVTDRQLMSTTSLSEAVTAAIAGGCTMVQLREKELAACDFYDEALRIKALTHKHHVPLIINDRVDIALAVDADGVHVGQSDLPATAVRQLIGPEKLLGVSASNKEEAVQAEKDGANYIGVGAMYTTATKQDAKTTSLEELAEICQAVTIPIVVIGGITLERISDFQSLDIAGLAVVSAIIAQPNIQQAASELKAAFLEQQRQFLS